jgi:hypothetical protein
MGYKAFHNFYCFSCNRSAYRLLFCGVLCVNVPAFAHFLYWTIDSLKYHVKRAAARYFFHEPVREKSSKKPLRSIVKCKKQYQRIDKWGQGLTC